MEIQVKRCLSGLRMWDVYVNKVFVERFDKKYEAKEFAEQLKEVGYE